MLCGIILEQVRADEYKRLADSLKDMLVEGMKAGTQWESRAKAQELINEMNKDVVGVAHMIVNGRGPRADK